MKTILSLLLAGALVCPAKAAPPDSTNEHQPQYAAVLFVIGVSIAAGYVILKIYSSTAGPSQTTPVRIILEKSYDHGTWTPIYTNMVILNGRTPAEIFRERMTDPVAFYRTQITP